MSKRISAPARQALIARYHAGESATALCLQAGVPRGTFYNHVLRNKRDTTYYKFHGKFYFICVIIDLYSRKVVAHRVSCKHSSQLITGAFKLAYVNRSPKPGFIFHSDRGTPYTAYAFQSLLYTCGVTPSFSPSGKPTHNAVMESFFASLKREELYRSNYRSVQEFKRGLERHMEFYNTERLHSTPRFKS